jgi:hypothetical protein
MKNRSDTLMRSGVLAWCADCGGERIFVSVEEGCEHDGCEFCCTTCDAAVFLLEVLDNTGAAHGRLSA